MNSSMEFFSTVKEYIRHPSRLGSLVSKAIEKAKSNRHKLLQIWEDFLVLFRLILAWARQEYKNVSKKTIFWAIAAVVYFLSPIDLIPDILPGGFIDDIAVITFILNKIRVDLDQFRGWEKIQKTLKES